MCLGNVLEGIMSTETKRLTFEAYLASPEMRKRYDIVDGVLLMSPGPTPVHQWVMFEISVPLRQFVNERGLGVVMVAPLDLVIRREPLRTRQPDILYLSAQRSSIRGVADLRGLQVLEVAPDLVVEVLSPSNTRRDIESKLEDYREVGVLECWLD
jgi:Uma2 family endonuclease